jgi:Holliday junction resolvase-like predicted endonuclease
MDLSQRSRKEIGVLGERIAETWLRKRGFSIVGRNIARKTGELDVVARKGETLHFVEVKTILCEAFPDPADPESRSDSYDPSANLHAYKIHKVARTAEWYAANANWEGDSQIDGFLVWLRRDGTARVRYLPQIV